MAGSYAGTGITVEVFMEEHEIAPVGVGLELFDVPVQGPAAPLILKEYVRHTARQFAGHLPQGHHLSRSGWEFDFEVVSKVVVKFLQRLDQQVVGWEPD